ncbi:MAG: AMP-binding protein [Flavobacteriales bacterium]|nr:AMP-binding protein [Flavobacteriales bacterium]
MSINLIKRANLFPNNIAITYNKKDYTYRDLLLSSQTRASFLLKSANKKDLNEDRIGFLVPSSFNYVAVQWAIWLAGGIAIPMCAEHTENEWQHVFEDANISMLVCHPMYLDKIKPLAEQLSIAVLSSIELDTELTELPEISPQRNAMILFTSGTTNKPKGVVLTHNNIDSQITCLIKSWGWTKKDCILEVLPLHHTHGIINILGCSLWSGAQCIMLDEFNAKTVWDKLASNQLSLFMAVPTIYSKLINYYNDLDETEQKKLSAGSKSLRLMVSGSAALPVEVLEKWKQITSHTLLERYGMTEIGMALSNPYNGNRKAGYVGKTLPSVEAKLVDESGNDTKIGPGEIYIKGTNVFSAYWNNPSATTESFKDGWFKTGDIAQIDDGYYKILGRNSVDIIKTGGYKVSALEIEDVLLRHPNIKECAVIGKPDNVWGEVVACFAVIKDENEPLNIDLLFSWTKGLLATYKQPRELTILNQLPRNTLGKIQKNKLK